MMCNWPEQDVKVGCVHYGPLISCYSETSLHWNPSGLDKMCRGFLTLENVESVSKHVQGMEGILV